MNLQTAARVLGLAAALALLIGARWAGARVATNEERCSGTLLQRYDDAWQRWHDGLALRDCDAEALADVRALAELCSEGEP